MIRSLSNITDISVIDQNEKDNILSFSKVKFDDSPIGSGGFGTVHKVNSIDGLQNSKYVVKIFTDENNKQHAYDTIEILHNKLKKRQLVTNIPVYHELPELLGLPFVVFKGYDNIAEKQCVAFLIYNLNNLGYEDFGSDSTKSNEFKGLQISDKLYLSYQLVKTIDFLHQIDFIHSDISENSLWVNPNRIQLSIIDYDSGFHFDSQDNPTTIGKVGHWIGSRFRNILGQQKDSSNLTTLDRLHEEYWVLSNAIFEVIFGAMPFFFLSDADDKTKRKYLNEFTWPNIDYSSTLFNKDNIQQHKAILSVLSQFGEAGLQILIDAFKKVFNSGYKNETKRLSTTEWREILFTLIKTIDNKPLILEFTSDKSDIKRKNEEVSFNFKSTKFNALYLNDILIPINQNNLTLPISDTSSITLRALNDFNFVEETIEIKADKVQPILIDVSLSKNLRDSIDPVILSWKTKDAESVLISSIRDKLPINGSVELFPESKTVYTITIIGYFDERITHDISLDVVQPVIELFNWEINLNEGIDNIKLNWRTLNTQKVTISPTIGITSNTGFTNIPIASETNFILIAEGLFSSTQREITAHPFPIPIIKEILVKTPKIEINAKMRLNNFNLPESFINIENFNFYNNISFKELEIKDTKVNVLINLPHFVNNNDLVKVTESVMKSNVAKTNQLSFSNIYNKIVSKISNK